MREGLRINQLNAITSEAHPRRGLCFCDNPARAWRISAATLGRRGLIFDLWMIFVMRRFKGKWQPHYEGSIPEFRIYNNIPKHLCLWIGERKTGWNPQK